MFNFQEKKKNHKPGDADESRNDEDEQLL